LRNRSNAVHYLSGDHSVAGFHCIEQSNLNRGDSNGCCQFFHLAFVSETSLHDAEAAHCAARGIISTYCPTINYCVVALVWSLSMGDSIDEHGGRGAAICSTVKHHSRFDLHNFAVGVSMVLHPNFCGVAVNMAVETFFTTVRNSHWTTRLHRQ
jgi:hypothetical protein